MISMKELIMDYVFYMNFILKIISNLQTSTVQHFKLYSDILNKFKTENSMEIIHLNF